MNNISSVDKDVKDKIISQFNNDANEIESEGDSDWFKQPLKERLSKRADNTDIIKN